MGQVLSVYFGTRNRTIASLLASALTYYFKRKYGLHKELHTLKGKVLGCWCYPKRCHGNHLKKLADDTNEV